MAHRILFLDNNFRFLTLISERLTYLGYEVSTASRAHDAVLKGIVVPPDVIVCDVPMPELNGWEFKRLLDQVPPLATVPILFLSTHPCLPAELYDPVEGIVDLLPKPYTALALEGAIAHILARERGRRKLMDRPLTGSVSLDGATLVDLCHVLALRAADAVVRVSPGNVTWLWARGRLIDAVAGNQQGEEAFFATIVAGGSDPTIGIEPLPLVPPRPSITKALSLLLAEATRRSAARTESGDASRATESDEQFLERLATSGLVELVSTAASGR